MAESHHSEPLPCDCTSVLSFQAGSGLRSTRPLVHVPYHTQTNGARFQDETYGKGVRLHNCSTKQKTAVCTLCGRVKKQ